MTRGRSTTRSRHGIEIQQFDLRQMRVQRRRPLRDHWRIRLRRNLFSAAVIRARSPESCRMTPPHGRKSRDILAGMLAEDFTQARFHARAKRLAAFAIGRAGMFGEPVPARRIQENRIFPALPSSAEAGPIAEIHLAQVGENRLHMAKAFSFNVGASVCCTRFIGLA